VRKLWTARALFLLTALALAAVVLEERRKLEDAAEPVRSVSGPSGQLHAIDPQADGHRRPRAFSTTLYLNWSSERRARRPAP
jgi:hypothetical protein